MAQGWDSYFHNLQPLPSDPRTSEVSSEPEGVLSQHMENCTGQYDLSNMVSSQEAISTNSDFSRNFYPNSASTSDCVYQTYYGDMPWQADGHSSVKDGTSKCENGDISNFTAGGLTTSSNFPASFVADLQEIKDDCEILTPSFLEDYSDVSSCSNADINETRPSCKFMNSSDPEVASHDNLVTKKHSPSEWPFTPSGNMSISMDSPNYQMPETSLMLPLQGKAKEKMSSEKDKMKTMDLSKSCIQKHPTSDSSKATCLSGRTENDNEASACTEQTLRLDVEDARPLIQEKESDVTIGSHINMTEDIMDRYPEDSGKKQACPQLDKHQRKPSKHLDVKTQETNANLNRIQENGEVCDIQKSPNRISSSGLNENRVDDENIKMPSSATECPRFGCKYLQSEDTAQELEDNTETLDAKEVTDDKRDIQNVDAKEVTDDKRDIQNVDAKEVTDDKSDIQNVDAKEVTDDKRDIQNVDAKEVTDDESDIQNVDANEVTEDKSDIQNVDAKEVTEDKSDIQNVDAKEVTDDESDIQNVDAKEVTEDKSDIQNVDAKEVTEDKSDIQNLDAKEVTEDKSDVQNVDAKEVTEAKSDVQNVDAKEVTDDKNDIQNLDAMEVTDDKSNIQDVASEFRIPARPSSESPQDIICSSPIEASKCDLKDACRGSDHLESCLQPSDSGMDQRPCSESEFSDPLEQTKLHTSLDKEKLQESVAATKLLSHTEDTSETIKESFQEANATFERDLGMLYGEPLSREDSLCGEHDTFQVDQENPVDILENTSKTHIELQSTRLKGSIRVQKKLHPIVILKTLEPTNDIAMYQCAQCKYSIQNVDQFIEHHHSHLLHKVTFCPTCNIYLLNNDPPKEHICDVKDFTLVRQEKKMHLKTVKQKPSHKCSTCGHISARFYHHVQHMRSHTGRTPFKCKGCGKFFSQSSCLYRHMRIAGRCQGPKHKRSAIDSGFISKPKQVMQKVVECSSPHTSLPNCYVKLVDISRTNVCHVCGKTFTSTKRLKKHMYVHKVKQVPETSEKRVTDELGKYKCPLCPRVFKYSYNRARHLRDCVKEKTYAANWKIGKRYQCPLCDAIFTFANNRQRHIKNGCLKEYLRTLGKTNPKISPEKKAKKPRPPPPTALEYIRRYKCSLCPARFCDPSGKYKHMKKHELYKLTGKTVRYKYSSAFPSSMQKESSIKKTAPCTDTSTSNLTNHNIVYSCSFCRKTFSTSLSLKKHEKSHKVEKPTLGLKGLKRYNQLINLETVHPKRIQCTVCKKILPTIGELFKHRKTHLQRGKLQCPYCPLQFQYPVYLLRHLPSHQRTPSTKERPQVKPELPIESLEEPKVFQCSLCKEVFQESQVLRKHCLKHISESSLQCPFCHLNFTTRRYLLRHMESHSGDKPFPCNDCGKQFYRMVYLNLHKKKCSAVKTRIEVTGNPAKTLTKLLQCSHCLRIFSRKNRLKKHLYGHESNSLLTCSKCKQCFGYTKLTQHQRLCKGTSTTILIDQHGEGYPKKDEEKSTLRNIATNGTKLLPHICPHCPQKFKYRSLLLRHLVSHNKEKAFSCIHCGHQYGSKSLCLKHEAFCDGLAQKDDSSVNSENQPRLSQPARFKDSKEKKTVECDGEYKCKFCTKTFLKPRNLRRHILTHTEVKPYRCKACESCFSRYDHLKLHETRCKGKRQRLEVCIPKISLDAVGKGWKKQVDSLAMTEQQAFECNQCLKSFSSKSNLSRHVSMLHNKRAFSSSRHKTTGISISKDYSLPKQFKNHTETKKLLDGVRTQMEPYPIKKQKNVCMYCPRSFRTSWQLRVHTRLHTGEKPFCCDICGEKFIRRDYLRRHRSKCSHKTEGKDLLSCDQCEGLFSEEKLEIHKKSCSNSPDVLKQSSVQTTSKHFSCAYCNSTFLIFSQLQQHFLNAHKQDTVLTTPIPTTSLQQHLSNIVSIKEEPLDATEDEQLNGDGILLFDNSTSLDNTEEKPFSCSFCNLRFKSKSGLGGHARIHLKPAPFPCKRCKKGFWNKNQLRNHLRKCKTIDIFAKNNAESSIKDNTPIDSVQNDSVLVFKESSKATHRGTGVLQTKFSCKVDSEDAPQENLDRNYESSSAIEKKAVHYQCSECDQSFTDGLMLISHLEDHGRVEQEKKRNRCSECGKVCNTQGNLDKHMKVHGISKTYVCSDCSKSFSSSKELFIHKKCHHNKAQFVCKVCSQKCGTNTLLRNHYIEQHPNDLHSCKLCNKSYTIKKSLMRHYKMTHRIMQLDKYLDCSENEEGTIDYGSIEVSASGDSDKDDKTDEGSESADDISDNSDSDAAPYFPCHVCGKTFLTSESLEDHQRCHLGEKPHECAECGKCFFQASQLLQHQRSHKSEFQCQTCHRGFVSLFALRNHKHTHGKSRPYRCSKCDLSFTGHSQLAEHMATHREDNFPCDICNRTFSCKSSRAEHRRTHSAAAGDLPIFTLENEEAEIQPTSALPSQLKYRCGVCQRCYKDPEELSEHGCIAAKERPFSCSDCDKYFLHDSHLKKHKATNHLSLCYEYQCDKCHISFSNHQTYLAHVKRHLRDSGSNLKEEDVEKNMSETVTNPPFSNEKITPHTSATQFECAGCGRNFLGSDAFRQHNCPHSLMKSECASTSTKKPPISCQTVGEEEEEEVDVTGEDLYNCFTCSKQFSSKSCLLEHQNKKHPKELLKCELCGRTFKQRRDLIQHERLHIVNRDIKHKTPVKKKKKQLSCFQCPNMFDTVHDMALHMKMHTEQDVGHHRCDMCYKSFTLLSQLKQHQESHVGQVVYECTECDKAFAFLHLLEEHQQTHAGPSQ